MSNVTKKLCWILCMGSADTPASTRYFSFPATNGTLAIKRPALPACLTPVCTTENSLDGHGTFAGVKLWLFGSPDTYTTEPSSRVTRMNQPLDSGAYLASIS